MAPPSTAIPIPLPNNNNRVGAHESHQHECAGGPTRVNGSDPVGRKWVGGVG